MKIMLTNLAFLCSLVIGLSTGNEIFISDPDITKNVSELILSKGYPVDNHVVETEDGYLLSVQRIPHGKNGQRGANKSAVFILHGIMSAASDWVMNFPNQSLGFILADAGYDVWLGNTRGNTYSRRNIKYTPDMNVFWNFSFDELAKFDIPAMIDHVLKETGEKQLLFIAHSQGNTAGFALLSESPEYNDKIKLFVALAPLTCVGHMTTPIRYFAPFTSELELFFQVVGVKDFAPNNGFVKFLSEYVCDTELKFLCENVMFLLFGADIQQLNATRLGVYTSHFPAGTSMKSLAHYAQLYLSKKFTKYDYGIDNLLHYNQITPPEYDASKITAPVALLSSLNDNFADPTDVAILQSKLKSLVSSYRVPFRPFNHVDFVIALQANTLVYDEVLRLLKEYH